MIPRKPQEGAKTDSARKVPKSPVRGDTAGQRKEDSGGSGGRSAGQHWARLRGESGYFSLERHSPGVPAQASSATSRSGPRSATLLPSPAQAASTPQGNPRASSPPQVSQRNNPRTSAPQQNTPRTSSPSRISTRESPRTLSTQRSHVQLSSSLRASSESLRTAASRRDSPQTAVPACLPQRDTPRTACVQRATPRAASPNRTAQWDKPRASCAQQDNSKMSCAQRGHPRPSSPNRTTQQPSPRTACVQRSNPRSPSPNRTAQRDNPRPPSPSGTAQRDHPRISCAQRCHPRSPSPNRTAQWDKPRASCAQQENSKMSCAQRGHPRPPSPTRSAQRGNPRPPSPTGTAPRDHPTPGESRKASCTRWEHLRNACAQRDNPHPSSLHPGNPGTGTGSSQSCSPRDHPRAASPRRSAPHGSPQNPSPHRTNQDIPWASFPLRPTQSDGPRTSSPSRSKQSEVPWASIALRPTQGDRPQAARPASPAQRGAPQASGSPARASPAAPAPGPPAGASPPHPGARGAPHASSCAVCIGHRDAPRASSPPRFLQHDPFPFFPEPRASEGDWPHHDPPYMPPAVCIGHRDAPRASSPPRHAPFDPFPFLPDAADAESQPPQHEPPQFPPAVCIGYRDAPRASSPPRQVPEPSLFLQELPRASTESLAPSTDSLRGRPPAPAPVCIGHRDAPSFSSPPRQALEPSLLFQDPPGTSTESLAPSTDSLLGSPLGPPQVCIGHRDAPRASSPPRHPPSDPALLRASSPPPGSAGSRGSAPPAETRHNLEREQYAMLADLPPPRRLAHREPGPPTQGSNGGRTRSPGRTEVERLFGQERRKSEAPGTFQARDEGRSPRPSQGHSQLRRQSSPAPSRQVAKPPAKQVEPALRSRSEAPHPDRRPEGDRRIQGSSPPVRTSARPRERELRTDRHQERSWGSQEEHSGIRGDWPGLEEPSLEGTQRSPSREHRESWGQPEAWEEPPHKVQGSLCQPVNPPENWEGLQPEIPIIMGWEAEGGGPPPQGPDRQAQLDWRDLLGLLQPPGEGAWARLPRLDWEGLLELLQAQLPRKSSAEPWGEPAKAGGPDLGPPGTKETQEQEQQHHPEGWANASLLNGHSTAQQPHSPAQPPSPACTSTQWPTTKVTSGPATATLADLEQPGQLGGPSPPEPEFQPEKPDESEPSRGTDSLTDQKQADSADKKPAEGTAGSPLKGRLVTSWRMPGDRPTLFNPYLLSLGVLRWQRPDLLNFKKGWMSILDEPGEWKKHWFVLTDSSLKYYRDSTAEEADELDGEIDLRSCTDVTEYAVQRNYGFQIHTKDNVYTLSAMTSGIRRNWIEALRKTVRPTSAPDVTKLSDSNKENTLHSFGPQKGSPKVGEQRAGSEVIGRGSPRRVDGPRQSLDYVELSPLTQASPQRARTPARTPDRPAKQEELERDLAQRSEERRKWFEATDSGGPETPTGEGPRRGLGAPLTEDQQSRLSEEIEKKWQELEKLPLREGKRVPLTALLNQSHSERHTPSRDNHEALEKEVQSLRAQLEAWRLRGEAPQSAPRPQEDGRTPPGYISQEACERSLAEMESSHQQVMEQLQRHHERELQRLQQEKEWLLEEETAATASAIEAMKKAYQEELSRELSKTRSLQQGPDGLRKQHQSDIEALKRELQVLSERYSQKCLEIGALTRQAEEREHTLQRCQQEGQELLRHNQELHTRLSEEIDRLRSFIASQGSGNSCGRSNERSSCELEVLLRVKENELQYLKKEVQCLRDELQVMQKDKRFTSGKYQDVYVELNHIKTRSEREIEQLKEHLRLAMAALQEKEATRNSLAE
ncbi:TRIO and F-actin-binding protein isoform X1 [Dipodomys merriami]|uniref:TRIO and F-actin-binding protein isoform X1 n=1 Tax=Dipodomys merriami TaxID=94247 RepID=UPI003855F276